jgi:tRNA-2-methylthio-N6-dimethylallyladenosine synthase
MPGQLPKAVVSERYQRLIDLQEKISLDENLAQVGRTLELLVATGEGRKDAATARMSGRARDGRLVHFGLGDAADEPLARRAFEQVRPGDVVTTTVTGAAPHHLIADAALRNHRRTRAGDAHAAGVRPRTGVGLGMPGIGAPAAAPVTSGCTL